MTKYVCLLRGINVGGKNKVEMKKLKVLFESLGFTDVSTYINSGNVLFESTEKDKKILTETIRKALQKAFGLNLRIVLRTQKEIESLCKKIPPEWENNEKERTEIFFLWDEYDSPKSLSLIKKNPDVDILLYAKGAIVWHIKRKDYTKSGLHKFIGTTLYKNMTGRNTNTVRKIEFLLKEKSVKQEL